MFLRLVWFGFGVWFALAYVFYVDLVCIGLSCLFCLFCLLAIVACLPPIVSSFIRVGLLQYDADERCSAPLSVRSNVDSSCPHLTRYAATNTQSPTCCSRVFGNLLTVTGVGVRADRTDSAERSLCLVLVLCLYSFVWFGHRRGCRSARAPVATARARPCAPCSERPSFDPPTSSTRCSFTTR